MCSTVALLDERRALSKVSRGPAGPNAGRQQRAQLFTKMGCNIHSMHRQTTPGNKQGITHAEEPSGAAGRCDKEDRKAQERPGMARAEWTRRPAHWQPGTGHFCNEFDTAANSTRQSMQEACMESNERAGGSLAKRGGECENEASSLWQVSCPTGKLSCQCAKLAVHDAWAWSVRLANRVRACAGW
jgi:hypothetical protein